MFVCRTIPPFENEGFIQNSFVSDVRVVFGLQARRLSAQTRSRLIRHCSPPQGEAWTRAVNDPETGKKAELSWMDEVAFV